MADVRPHVRTEVPPDVHPEVRPDFTAVNLITGFLGSGKTTLLKRLLAHPSLSDTAVLINEFGEIGLDHHLLERIDENIVLLQSGCLCCTIRGELADSLRSLHSKRERGEVPWFRRVVIESTGLADPFPILSTIHADPVLRHHFQLGHVVTVVDAVNGDFQLDEYEQSVRQAAIADRLVLTKTGLASPGATQALIERLRVLNPLAPLVNAEHDDLDAEVLLCTDLLDMSHKTLAAQQWFAAERTAPAWLPTDDAVRGAELPAPHGRYLGQQRRPRTGLNRHDADIRAFSIELAEPLDWTLFGIWLTMLVHRHGSKILRLKGILNVQGSATPVAVHGVQHLIHPPVHMQAWPDVGRNSVLVFIVKNIERATVLRSLNAFIGSQPVVP